MKRVHILSKLLVVFLLVGGVIGCSKDDNDDIIAKPIVTLTELGSGNSKKAFAGSDLHIEAEIVAAGTIDRILLEIHGSGSGAWELKETFTEGYTNTKNAEFHEHVDIPSTVAPGTYHFHLEVVDKNGQVTAVESDLTIEKKSPSSALIFTKITGDASLEAHGDHFHGLGSAIEGASDTVTFDATGAVIAHGHMHLEPTGIYKVSLKTYDATGNETQNKFITNAATAANYKAFLIGGNFVLNPSTSNESGAIFQPRETLYADGTAVSGATATTGVITYFTAGSSNAGEKDVTFVMRRLNAGIKPNITRLDWNRADYATAFGGTNELELKFEIHAE